MSNIPAADRLKSLVERINRLEDEKKGLADDIKDIYVEAKSAGFNPKALRTAAKRARMTKDQVDKVKAELDDLDMYLQAIGILD